MNAVLWPEGYLTCFVENLAFNETLFAASRWTDSWLQ
jgi:hypothetical protein